MENYPDYFNELENKRVNALYNYDAMEYFRCCNESGVDIENKELYEKGQFYSLKLKKSLENIIDDSSKKLQRKRTVPDYVYENFHNEAGKLKMSLGEDVVEKEMLLKKYFPKRFGNSGKDPVCNKEIYKIGSLFKKIVEYSEKRIKQ
jgi:hypothetical protein